MRALIMRKASDNGALSGAAVETRISVWAWAIGSTLSEAKATAAASSVRLMV
jgi:hypothetical protein